SGSGQRPKGFAPGGTRFSNGRLSISGRGSSRVVEKVLFVSVHSEDSDTFLRSRLDQRDQLVRLFEPVCTEDRSQFDRERRIDPRGLQRQLRSRDLNGCVLFFARTETLRL